MLVTYETSILILAVLGIIVLIILIGMSTGQDVIGIKTIFGHLFSIGG